MFGPRSLLSGSLLLLGCALVACLKGQAEAPSDQRITTEAYLTPANDLSSARLLARGAIVTCAEGAVCSPSVGLLSVALPTGATQCTATLVAPDVVATNAHCLPVELQKEGASCADRIWMNFASREDGETQIGCRTVLAARGAVGAVVADYAFLQLGHPSVRPFARISRAGFPDQVSFVVEKVDPSYQRNAVRGQQSSVTCLSAQHTVLFPDFTQPFYEVPLLTDCTIVHGNSGAPVFGSDGGLRGIVFARLEVGNLSSELAVNNIVTNAPLVPMGVAANMACLPLPAGVPGAAPRPDHCSEDNFLPNKSEIGRTEDVRQALTAAAAVNNKEPAFGWFDWESTPSHATEVEFKALCVHPERVDFQQSQPVGILHYQIISTLDDHTRYVSSQLNPGAFVSAEVRPGEKKGEYAVRFGHLRYTVPACRSAAK